MTDSKPEVAVIMGSASDWETMKHACDMLDQFEVPYVKQVISAHRTPELMAEFAHGARVIYLTSVVKSIESPTPKLDAAGVNESATLDASQSNISSDKPLHISSFRRSNTLSTAHYNNPNRV